MKEPIFDAVPRGGPSAPALALALLLALAGSARAQWGGNTGGHQIQDEGAGLTQRPILDFAGAGIACADAGSKTKCTVAAGAAGPHASTHRTGGSDPLTGQIPGNAATATALAADPANCAVAGEKPAGIAADGSAQGCSPASGGEPDALHKSGAETVTGTKTFSALPILSTLTGVLKATAGAISAGAVDLASEVSGILPGTQVSPATTAARGAVVLSQDGETTAGEAVQATDARLSDARAPLAHGASHEDGGADELDVGGLPGQLAQAQPVEILLSGATVGTRPAFNLIPGANVTLGVTDNSLQGRVDINVATTGGGGQVVGDNFPACTVAAFMGAPPAGWLSIDGSTFSGTTFPDLAACLGGTTLPNANAAARFLRGGSTGIGSTGGTESHDHGGTTGASGGTSSIVPAGTTAVTNPHSHSISSASHVPPFLVVRFAIKATGGLTGQSLAAGPVLFGSSLGGIAQDGSHFTYDPVAHRLTLATGIVRELYPPASRFLAFGDSFTAGSSAPALTDPQKPFSTTGLLFQATGYAITNAAVPGQVTEQIVTTQVAPRQDIAAGDLSYVSLAGNDMNNATIFGQFNSEKENNLVYRSALFAGVWLGQVDAKKIRATSAAVAKSAGWTLGTSTPWGWDSQVSTTPGDTLTLATSAGSGLRGTAIYVLYACRPGTASGGGGAGGIFEVTIDGVKKGTVDTELCHKWGSDNRIATAARFADSLGDRNHNVVLTVQTGTVEVLGFSSNAPLVADRSARPRVLMPNVVRVPKEHYLTVTGRGPLVGDGDLFGTAFGTAIWQAASELEADGFAIARPDIRAAYDPDTQVSTDNLHANAAGYAAIVEEVLRTLNAVARGADDRAPSARKDEVQVANEKGGLGGAGSLSPPAFEAILPPVGSAVQLAVCSSVNGMQSWTLQALTGTVAQRYEIATQFPLGGAWASGSWYTLTPVGARAAPYGTDDFAVDVMPFSSPEDFLIHYHFRVRPLGSINGETVRLKIEGTTYRYQWGYTLPPGCVASYGVDPAPVTAGLFPFDMLRTKKATEYPEAAVLVAKSGRADTIPFFTLDQAAAEPLLNIPVTGQGGVKTFGARFISLGFDNALMLAGAHREGSSWIADVAAPVIYNHQFGAAIWYLDTGLTPGNAYTPTQTMGLTRTSLGPISLALDLGTGAASWKDEYLSGFEEFFGTAAGTAVAPASKGRFRYDTATQRFVVSHSTGAYLSLATRSGAYVADNCVKSDGSGNFVDAGAPCGTGSGGGSGDITAVGTVASGDAFTSVVANRVLASPNGSTGAVTDRALVTADLLGTTAAFTNAANNFGVNTQTMAVIDQGSAIFADKLLAFHSGNNKYGYGMAVNEWRHYWGGSSGFFSLGEMSIADGTTFTEKHRFSSNEVKLGGGVYELSTRAISSSVAATATDRFVRCTAGAGGITYTLPAATGSGRLLDVKKMDSAAGQCTVDGAGAETVDGIASFLLTAQYQAVTLRDAASGVWDVQ